MVFLNLHVEFGLKHTMVFQLSYGAFWIEKIENCSPTVDVGFVKLTSDSFCTNRVFKMNIQFCCPVTYAAVVL
jgi:hypothetical protein